ncbi:cytochrome c [Synechococcus sp. CS-1328]|nr:cytochrome c [Synechococcus sp. CS-1328]
MRRSALRAFSPSVTAPPSPALSSPDGLSGIVPRGEDEGSGGRRRGLVVALVAVAAAACILLVLVVLPAARMDPYTRQTIELTGSAGNGGRLFRLNCAGCHGLAAQGLVGPNLHGVDRRKSDRQLIEQVVSGRTPPMPRFQPDPQAMADLLAFLHTLP